MAKRQDTKNVAQETENQNATTENLNTNTEINETVDSVTTPKMFTLEEVEQFKKEWQVLAEANKAAITINTVDASEPKAVIVKELENAVNQAVTDENDVIAKELNGILECLLKLRNQVSHLHANHVQDAPIVKRIKTEILGLND